MRRRWPTGLAPDNGTRPLHPKLSSRVSATNDDYHRGALEHRRRAVSIGLTTLLCVASCRITRHPPKKTKQKAVCVLCAIVPGLLRPSEPSETHYEAPWSQAVHFQFANSTYVSVFVHHGERSAKVPAFVRLCRPQMYSSEAAGILSSRNVCTASNLLRLPVDRINKDERVVVLWATFRDMTMRAVLWIIQTHRLICEYCHLNARKSLFEFSSQLVCAVGTKNVKLLWTVCNFPNRKSAVRYLHEFLLFSATFAITLGCHLVVWKMKVSATMSPSLSFFCLVVYTNNPRRTESTVRCT